VSVEDIKRVCMREIEKIVERRQYKSLNRKECVSASPGSLTAEHPQTNRPTPTWSLNFTPTD